MGKTTVTAALASSAARAGRRVLVVEVEGKSGLAGLLGGRGELGVGRSCSARRPRPDRARRPGPHDHARPTPSSTTSTSTACAACRSRLGRPGVLDIVATAAPGLDDILVLGKVKQLERAGTADLIVLDAPAAGHAITFLQSAKGLLDAVDVGPINTQARDVLELLSDPDRTQVVLVTLPEETPVNELVETAFALEDAVGVSLGPGRRERALPRRRPGPGGRAGRGWATDVDPSAGRGRPASGPDRAGPAGRAGRAPRPSGCRSPRSTCRSCSRPTSPPTTWSGWPTLLDSWGAGGMTAREESGPGPALGRLVAERSIVICCGSGGVGQDHDGGGARARGGGPRAPGRRGHHRPGPAAGRRPRPGRAHQRAEPDRRRPELGEPATGAPAVRASCRR